MFDLAVYRLNAELRLPPLERAICHGYQACCACSECGDRAKLGARAPEQPRQPWEAKVAA